MRVVRPQRQEVLATERQSHASKDRGPVVAVAARLRVCHLHRGIPRILNAWIVSKSPEPRLSQMAVFFVERLKITFNVQLVHLNLFSAFRLESHPFLTT